MATSSNPTTTPQSTVDATLAEIDRLRAENERLKAQAQAKVKISLKVTEKGGLSVYGLQRFPVTLYREQWTAIIERADEIMLAVSKLPFKADKAGF